MSKKAAKHHRKLQNTLHMPPATTERRPNITRPEVTRRLHTMLT